MTRDFNMLHIRKVCHLSLFDLRTRMRALGQELLPMLYISYQVELDGAVMPYIVVDRTDCKETEYI